MLDSLFSFTNHPGRSKKSTQKQAPGMSHAVQKNFEDISYLHTINTRARSYRLKIDPNEGLVLVTPTRYNQDQINRFIATNRAWIETHVGKLTQKKEFLETDTTIRIFDALFTKHIIEIPGHASTISLQEKVLTITVSEQTPTKMRNVIERFLQQTAEQYIVPRTKQLAEKMHTEYARIKFGQHKTQWGSCHSNGTLTFNWRLVHAPTQVIDYVIIHELAHRTHLNHSAAFWALVAKFDPKYETHKQWLKRYGLSVG